MLIDTYRNVLHLSELQFFQLKLEEEKRNGTKQENKLLSIHNDNYEGEIMTTIMITNAKE